MSDPIDDVADIMHLPPGVMALAKRVVADKDAEIERLRAALVLVQHQRCGECGCRQISEDAIGHSDDRKETATPAGMPETK